MVCLTISEYDLNLPFEFLTRLLPQNQRVLHDLFRCHHHHHHHRRRKKRRKYPQQHPPLPGSSCSSFLSSSSSSFYLCSCHEVVKESMSCLICLIYLIFLIVHLDFLKNNDFINQKKEDAVEKIVKECVNRNV